MHIPDGYMAPQTAVPLLAVMVPVWGAAVKKVQKNMKKREVPLLAVGAAFSFTIMMFNLPVPGGSSAHAVGAVLLALLLGPWAACLGVSTALIIQALVFNDGGILAIGANCLNMGVIMPFIGYYTYKLIKGRASAVSGRGVTAAFIAGYVGLCFAALSTAIMFGLQYEWFKAVDGTPLYFPLSLKVAVTVMMTEHLALAGPVEGIVTALGLTFVARSYPELLKDEPVGYSKLWWALGALIILCPLGLIATGTAFGEWGLDELLQNDEVGFIPQGLARFADFWQHSVLPDYSIPGMTASFTQSAMGYIISAVVGVGLVLLVITLLKKIVKE